MKQFLFLFFLLIAMCISYAQTIPVYTKKIPAVKAIKPTEAKPKQIKKIVATSQNTKMTNEAALKVIQNIEMVSVGDFSIGKYEVTQAQWQAVMGTNPSEHTGCPNCPVENVSWNDLQDFLQKLNAKTGKNYRLPSEAEWEYAAKGGSHSHGYNYAGSNDLNAVAWYSGNSDDETHPVGQKQPNELGIYDMTGNVWEWCSDWYDINNQDRVIRGGGWGLNPATCRVAGRDLSSPDDRSSLNGFRVVLSP